MLNLFYFLVFQQFSQGEIYMLSAYEYMEIFHETKNSITLINSSLQLMLKKHPEVANFEFWNEAMQELTFLRNMISELSQNQSCEPLNLKPESIYDLLHEITDSVRSLEDNCDFHCNLTIEENLPLIPMDKLRIKQLLTNLMKNAYEAMNETGTINLNIYQENDFIRIDIIDFGGGIPKEVENTLFDLFISSKPNGSGLGLAISKKIIEAHAGKLLYESRPGDGCTFSVLLPLHV